jgi:hypothetical protein
MSTRRKTSNSYHRGKSLKQGARGFLKAIERVTKTMDHAIRKRIPRRWLHINLITQLTIEKNILNIKLGHEPMANKGHDEKGSYNGHMSQRRKSLIVITTMLLLKTMSHKTSFVMLKRTIRASFNLIYPLTSDRKKMGRKRNRIPSSSALKRNNLLSHCKLPFRMNNNITI